MSKFNDTVESARAIGRGIKKTYDVTVTVTEALAWLAALVILWGVVYITLQGERPTDYKFYLSAVSASVLSLRATIELGKYFRKCGQLEAGHKAKGRA